ncbi:MAG: hypothetical protein GF310_07245 [candidate division Zixibacteria bacterium]|nr:hypothetical protein [candidate division Zixibacteria bacterium]
MKTARIFIVAALALLLMGSLVWAEPYDQNKDQSADIAQDTDKDTYLNINNLLCFIYNNGNFAYDSDMVFGKNDGLYYPRGTDKTVVYAAGIWVGAMVNGQVRITIAEYGTEYVPGNMEGGQPVPDGPEYKVYKINRGDNTQTNPDYANWPSDQGAPIDGSGDPLMYGDQMCWSVFNDADASAHNNNAGMTDPLGLEIQQTSFAYDRPGDLGRVIYLKYLIINEGGETLNDTYISLWCDPDLGHAGDDLVGCDTILSLGYCYNEAGGDYVYGDKAPAVGFDFLQGPIVQGDPSDSAIYMGEWIYGYRNLPMASFNKYINGTDPESPIETYNYMQGDSITGAPLVSPDGDTTTFMHPGDPVAGTGWLDVAADDRRFMMSTGPFDMMPGDTQEVVAAVLVGQGDNRLESITRLKEHDQAVQMVYDNMFDLPQSPMVFDVYGRGLDGAVDLIWSTDMQDYYQDYLEPLGEFFVFEGFNIYQGESESGPWHKIATFDMTAPESQMTFEGVAGEYVIDCSSEPPECDSVLRPWNFETIYNWVVNPETNLPELKVVQTGTEAGTMNHYYLDEDMVFGGPIINEMPYYFAVTGYLVNIEDVLPEDSVFAGINFLGFNAATLESPIEPITIIPKSSPLTEYTDTADHIAGNSQGLVAVEYVDMEELVSGNYEVNFNPAGTWNLERDGLNLLINQTNQSGDYNYEIIDGIMVRVIGPESGIALPASDSSGGVIEIYNSSGLVDPPDNVFWSLNSTGDWYISSDLSGSSDESRARFDWRGLMGVESWEIRFTSTGSEYYDWITDQKWPNRAPFEVWHYSGDSPTPDRRDFFFIIDDDGSGGWSWGDRIYITETEYPPEPLPENAGDAGYDWPNSFHLGRVVFNDYSGMFDHPEYGTVARFNSTIPNTVEDIFIFEVSEMPVCGDMNTDNEINVTDAVYLINYIFLEGPAPPTFESADVNCDLKVNITDVVYVIIYVFQGGHEPCDIDGDGFPDC